MAGLPAAVEKAMRQPGGASTWLSPSLAASAARMVVRHASITAIVSPPARAGRRLTTSPPSSMLLFISTSERALGFTPAATSTFSASTCSPWPAK